MSARTVSVGAVSIGPGEPLAVIAGPCVIESRELCLEIAGRLEEMCERLSLGVIFKASFDKANRASLKSFRGPGIDKGLEILAEVKAKTGLPIDTDIHEPWQAEVAAKVADMIQIPAFLCRQTDLLAAAGKTGKPVFIKKGQFMNPLDMRLAAEKVESEGNTQVLLGERGTFFGYGNLVVDMRSLAIMRGMGYGVIFDATHSVQLPGGAGTASGGQREFVAPLARAAVAAGVDGVFLEVHPEPEKAPSDAATMLPLGEAAGLLAQLKEFHDLRRRLECAGQTHGSPRGATPGPPEIRRARAG
jgi:2-dehydro-3-deoxyphosphooctonate aldolase (KDO 8-P synthase)